jgi:hypothetical protein
MKPSFFFDYVFYRVADLYMRWKYGGGGIDTGVIAVAGTQSLTLIIPLVVLSRIIFDSQEMKPYAKVIAGVAVGMFTLFYIWNTIRYNRDRYELLREYWKDEPINQRRNRGLIVLVVIVSPIVILLVGGYYF